MIKFEKLKEGMIIYDVRKNRELSRVYKGEKWNIWPVYIRKIDTVNRRVQASWNHNPDEWMSEKQITSYRRKKPVKPRLNP